LIAIVAAGGFMRGFAGFGTTLVMVPFLSILISPREAVLIALTTDVLVMIPLFPKAAVRAEWKPIIPLLIGSFFAMPFGVWFLIFASLETIKLLIAILVIGSAMLLLSGWTYKGARTTLLSFLIGSFSGVTNSATGIGGPPIAVYFIAKGMSAINLRASLNAVGFIMEGFAAVVIYIAGEFDTQNLLTILILLPFMLLFTWLGSLTFRIIDNNLFKKLVLSFLIISGGYIFLSAL